MIQSIGRTYDNVLHVVHALHIFWMFCNISM